MTVPGNIVPLLMSEEAAAGGYQVSRSLRFNAGDSAYISRVVSSAGNRKTFTLSWWMKKSGLTTFQSLFNSFTDSNNRFAINFDSSIGAGGAGDYLTMFNGNAGAFNNIFQTNALFRDASAWYHIVIAIDTTQASSSERVKLWVNGTLQTFSSYTAPSQNADLNWNSANTHYFGVYGGSPSTTAYGFNGYLAEVHHIDGQQLTASSFAETDATTGQWIPKLYSGSYGTNGFKLNFSDNSAATAAALGKDTSGNSNNWTPNNFAVDAPRTLPAVAFDGNGDYLTVPGSSDFAFGTGDFTIEFFLYSKEASPNNKDVFSNPAGIQLFFVSGKLRYNHALVAGLLDTDNAIPQNKWTHCALVRNGGTTRWYVNGVQNSGSYSDSKNWTQTTSWYVGSYDGTQQYSNILISNLRVVKGTAVYTANFTPTAPLTSITNTKLLCCQSSSSATTAAVSPGTITASGDVYATTLTDSQAGNDSLVDTPTSVSATDTGIGGEIRGNYCTLNPLDKNTLTLANGNLQVTGATTNQSVRGTIFVSSGKWYYEATITNIGTDAYVGFASNSYAFGGGSGRAVWRGQSTGGILEKLDGTNTTSVGQYTTGDVIGCAIDFVNDRVDWYKNNTLTVSYTSAGLSSYAPLAPLLQGGGGSYEVNVNFGQRAFAYTAPSGFKALVDTNLPAPVIAKPNTVFDTKLYTGNGSTQTISGLGFSPDFVWLKSRSSTASHRLLDVVRGATKVLYSNATDAEDTDASTLTAFNSDGFSLGASTGINGSATTYVAWAWDAGSSNATNTQGSITSSVRANASAGFSIVTYTGTGSLATVGHGLGAAPSFIIVKARSTTYNWSCYHISTGKDYVLNLNTTGAGGSGANSWGTAAPTSTVFGVKDAGPENNGSGVNFVAYCFAPVAGYSSMGSYVGNGSSNGTFVYTGFRPRFILMKDITVAHNWQIIDSARDSYNVASNRLFPNTSGSEVGSSVCFDFLSNGFKARDPFTTSESGSTYIYFAVAESPFQYARAR